MRLGCFSMLFISLLFILPSRVNSQTYDTISNWDGITQNWHVNAGGSAIVTNPYPGGINTSEHCMMIVTSPDLYDLMIYDLAEPVNFDQFPRYNLKIYAPPGGGDVTLKFENSTNTESHEIVKTPVPGQWTNLEYDFSGLSYNNLTRMVIFLDFQGTEAGIIWYIDDITREILPPLELQSNLPIIVINTFGISIPDEPKITAHMGVIDNGEGNLNNIGDPFNDFDGFIGIEIRGKSTQSFPKKSYAFETRDSTGEDMSVSLLGMPEESDWVLYAPYTDKSMLRNVVSFDIARKTGGYHSRTRFCEVILNNDYKGVYVLMEKIKKDKNRVDIATLNPDEISGDDLTGGYILRVDWRDQGFAYGVDGWKSHPDPPYKNAHDITFQYYYPDGDEIVEQQRSYIRNFVTAAENLLTRSGFTNPDEGYQKYLDAASFVDFMLVSEISKEVDKYRLSTYFFKDKDSNGGKIVAGPAWDFNLGYGNVDYWPPGIDYTGWAYTRVEPVDYGIMFWWKRLMEDPYFRDLAKTRWVDLRQDKLSDASITSAIDSIVNLIDSAKDRNFDRWPILGQYVWPNYNWQNNSYADEVAYFENFLFNRLQWMDNNMAGNVLQPWISISAEGNLIRMKIFGDYFRRTQLEPENFRLNNAPGGMFISQVEYLNASECRLTISGELTGFPDISVTAFKKILNTYQDLTSNKLASAGIDMSVVTADIDVFQDHSQIRIRCNQPELLPGQVEIINVTGQSLGTFSIGKTRDNIISPQLIPGLYLIVFNTDVKPQIRRIVIVNPN